MPASSPTYNRTPYYGVDNDAKSYAAYVLARSSVTISDAEIYNISSFIQTFKAQNVWKDLIDCWTFRSSQTTGTGTLIYGLKTRITGTLVGSSSWGTGGITFTGAAAYVSLSALTSIINGLTSFSFGVVYNYSGGDQNMFIQIGTTSTGCNISINRNVTNGATNVGEFAFTINNAARGLRSTGNTLTDAHHVQGAYDNPIASGSLLLDGATLSSSVLSTNTAVVATVDTRAGNSATTPTHLLSAFYIFRGNIGTSALSAIASSYKTSIGQNLSLP